MVLGDNVLSHRPDRHEKGFSHGILGLFHLSIQSSENRLRCFPSLASARRVKLDYITQCVTVANVRERSNARLREYSPSTQSNASVGINYPSKNGIHDIFQSFTSGVMLYDGAKSAENGSTDARCNLRFRSIK